ncbi:MAG: rRNA maturation RNase YbeY [Alphaproteobacteria bacterium]|nr:rRNA maturation RNase YbeY [Alphaproteobacteria bacterium]
MSDALAAAARRVAIVIADPDWRKAALPRGHIRRAAARALLNKPGRAGTVTILLTGDTALKDLNTRFRGKPKPTNVLSFPAAGGDDYLGDIAIAYGVTATEAQAAQKPFAHHAAHLAIHGVLHLLGYDHETEADAAVMEPLEIAILAAMKIPDPYTGAKAA